MIALTPEDITQLRDRLADYPEATEALQEIEDCDGDLEDAAISLARFLVHFPVFLVISLFFYERRFPAFGGFPYSPLSQTYRK